MDIKLSKRNIPANKYILVIKFYYILATIVFQEKWHIFLHIAVCSNSFKCCIFHFLDRVGKKKPGKKDKVHHKSGQVNVVNFMKSEN